MLRVSSVYTGDESDEKVIIFKKGDENYEKVKNFIQGRWILLILSNIYENKVMNFSQLNSVDTLFKIVV